MNKSEEPGVTFVSQVYDVRTKKDGGGRMQIDFGLDAMEAVQWIQRVAAMKNVSFMVSFVPIKKQGEP